MKIYPVFRVSCVLFYWLILMIAAIPCLADNEIRQDTSILSLSLKPEGQDKFEFGKITKALCVIKNLSDKAIVVFRLRPNDNRNYPENCINLAYHYNVPPYAATAPMYALQRGFLLPNQEITVECLYRPSTRIEEFIVRYVSAKNRYDGTSESLLPLKVYHPAKDFGEYLPFDEKRWLRTYNAVSQISTINPTSSRGVFMPDFSYLIRALQSNFKPDELIIKVPLDIDDERNFYIGLARETAAKIIQVNPDDVRLAYSTAFGGYMIMEEESSWLLANSQQATRGKLFAPFPLTMLYNLDIARDYGVDIVVHCYYNRIAYKDWSPWKLWGIYPVKYQIQKLGNTEEVNIKSENLLEFLGMVRERDGRIIEIGGAGFELKLPKK